MPEALASRDQVRAIHALKGRLGLDEPDYRAVLAGFGVGSSKELSRGDAAKLLDRFRTLTRPSGEAEGHPLPAKRERARGALRLDGPYAGVCRALWLSAWNLGLVADRQDTALAAFVKRQTGLDSPNWVRDPVDGAKAVEGLKAWIAREAGLAWPGNARARRAGISLATARKLAVIAAQQRILGNEGVDVTTGKDDGELDELMQVLGRLVRALQAPPAAVR